MDVTASGITVVSSVWTLTVYCKQLIEGLKNGEERANDLERKARSFATIIWQVNNAYGSHATEPQNLQIETDETQIREDIKVELIRCKEDLKAFEEEVSKLLGHRKTGKFGVYVFLNAWREKVAQPTFERIEKSIAEHLSYLHSLMEVHHGHRLDETRKDLKQLLTSMDRMFDKIEDFTRVQSSNSQDSSSTGEIGTLQRRESDATLVNSIEDETPNALHTLAQTFFTEMLNQMTSNKGSVSLPSGQSGSPPDPRTSEQNPAPRSSDFRTKDTYGRSNKPSFDGNALSDFSFQRPQVPTRPLDASPRLPSLSSSPTIPMRRSVSGTSGSSTLARIDSIDYVDPRDISESVGKEEDSYKWLALGSPSRTNRAKGAELLQAVKGVTGESFKDLLQDDVSLEERDEKGKTPLILAASLGRVDLVEILLENGANVRAKDKKQATALHNAVESRSWSTMSLLLKYKSVKIQAGNIDINFPDQRGRTPLHCCTSLWCAEDDMKDAARELIAHEADINIKDNSQVPPVYYAIKHRRYSVVELFLTAGADLNFERPETSADIGTLLDAHLNGKDLSLISSNTSKRKDSTKSPPARKGSRFSFSRSRSGGKT